MNSDVKALTDELIEGTTPLGRILHSMGITLHRAGLEVTTVTNKEAAKELGLSRSATLYKRSYRLEGRSGGTVKIQAAITEFISPRAARTRTVRKGDDRQLEGPLAEAVAARTG